MVIDILATATAMRSDPADLERLRGMKQKLARFRATLGPNLPTSLRLAGALAVPRSDSLLGS